MRILSALSIIFLALLSRPLLAQDCFDSAIVTPSPFLGNNGEIFKLLDGSLWEVKFEYSYLYAYSPRVIICPTKKKLLIGGKSLNIEKVGTTKSASKDKKSNTANAPVAEIIESNIDGDFSGWEGETIFKLTNGQIWQQSSYAYTYSYKYRPQVMIIPTAAGFEMQVDGLEQRIRVVRIK